jgi:tetrahydromethanopterin S-methyltransferase subunit F
VDSLLVQGDKVPMVVRDMNPNFAMLIAPPVELPPLPSEKLAEPDLKTTERVISKATNAPIQPSTPKPNPYVDSLDWNKVLIAEGIAMFAALLVNRPFGFRDIVFSVLILVVLNWLLYWVMYAKQPLIIQQILKKLKM